MNEEPSFLSHHSEKKRYELSLIELWKVLSKYKWYICFVTVLSTVLSYTYISNLPEVYKSSVVITVDKNEASITGVSSGFLSQLTPYMTAGPSSSKYPLFRLRTRDYLIDYINSHNLKPILFSAQWNNEKKKWADEEPSDKQAYSLLKSMISITPHTGDEVGLVTISLEWRSPDNVEHIADITNNLVNDINKLLKNQVINELEDAIKYLNRELNQTSISNSRLILYQLIEEKTKSIMMENATENPTFNIIEPAITPLSAEPKLPYTYGIIWLISGLLFGVFTSVAMDFLRFLKKAVEESKLL